MNNTKKNSSNERVTEELTRELLKINEDYTASSEQVTLTDGKRPDFLIDDNADFVMVIECKRARSHSKDAVRQVKGYAATLSKDKNVIAISVAGTKDPHVRAYYLKKEDDDGFTETFKPLKTESLLPFQNYKDQVEQIELKEELNEKTLKSKADELNNLIRTHADVGIQRRSTLIAAILIAVEDDTFRTSYAAHKITSLSTFIYRTIDDILAKEQDFPMLKRNAILHEFEFLKTNINLNKERLINGRKVSSIRFFVDYIVKKVYLKLKKNSKVDLLAEFYTEFFRRTSLSGKELGIVLTPEHVKRFMARLVNVNIQDTVLDTCTGTGGFLITCMNIMLEQAITKAERTAIKQNKLIGVELQANMFLMAYASMKFHGDGKSNLYLGDAVKNPEIIASYTDRATKGLINPPYSLGKKDKSLDEWAFVLKTLDALKNRGQLAVIIPVSKYIGGNATNVEWKTDIMKKHTLKAVISMPDQLFYPTGTVTAVGIFEAHLPHDKDVEVWFCSLKNDGHEITRVDGRADTGAWDDIEQSVLDAFKNKKEMIGQTANKAVTASDEWIAEAYLTPDYSLLTSEMIINNFKDLNRYEY